MKPAPLAYEAPTTLSAACTLLQEHGDDAKLLAGGQSLIPVMNFRLAQPTLLVDLNRLTELTEESADPHGNLRLGSMLRQSQLERSPLVAQYAPLVHQTIPYIAHPQIRNRGTIGGSLAHADPAGELPVCMVALDARFKLEKTGSSRWVDARDFYLALFTTALEAEEILTEIEIPPLPSGSRVAFKELARRHGDYAMAGVAVVLRLDDRGICRAARLVYLNLGDIPMVAEEAAEMLIGETPGPELIAAVAKHAAQHEIDPSSNIHASSGYKRHLAAVLTKRALNQALEPKPIL